MLGALRFLLAIGVVVAHLAETPMVSHWGVCAVFGFYLLSGYLMTLVLNETYSFNARSFFINRIIKLYPPYFIVAGLTLVAINLLPGAAQFHSAWTISTRWLDIAGNTLIFPFEAYDRSFRLVPPSWSLAVELINYALLFAVVARSSAISGCTFLAALAFHVHSLWQGDAWTVRYAPFYAALLPFSLGAIIYFQRAVIARLSRPKLEAITIGLALTWTANLLAGGFLGGLAGPHFNTVFYVNLLTLGGLVAALTHPVFATVGNTVTRRLGDLAYPVFLTHWLIGFIVSTLLLSGEKRGYTLLALSLPPAIALSWLISIFGDATLEPLRNRIRPASKTRTQPTIATSASAPEPIVATG